MIARPKLLPLCSAMLLAMAPALVQAQIFTDEDFLASDYTTDSNLPNNTDVRFNVDYSNIDIFGDGYITASLPEAPRTQGGAAATTGAFLTANHDIFNPASGPETFAAILPTMANLNVGNGTSNPNYKMTVDVFHSSSAGVDTGTSIEQVDSTNYTLIGLNQSNTTVQLQGLNAPGETGGLPGQGLALTITADGGAADDYITFYGGARYYDRNIGEVEGQLYSQASNNETAATNTGLLGRHLNDYWEAQGLGFEFDETDEDPTNNLTRFTGEAQTYGPDPNDLENYYVEGDEGPVLGSIVQPLHDAFPLHDNPLHYSCGPDNCNLAAGESLAPNTELDPGIPYNRWATHELYWVDEQFTYVIDGVPVLQFAPDSDGEGGDDNIFNDYSDAGTVILGFWDRFADSISQSPDGGNFVVYDNLTVEEATAAEVPSLLGYLGDQGYLLAPDPGGADADGDGDVDGFDFLILQRDNPSAIADWKAEYGTGTSTIAGVPEPSTGLLALGLTVAGLITRRRI